MCFGACFFLVGCFFFFPFLPPPPRPPPLPLNVARPKPENSPLPGSIQPRRRRGNHKSSTNGEPARRKPQRQIDEKHRRVSNFGCKDRLPIPGSAEPQTLYAASRELPTRAAGRPGCRRRRQGQAGAGSSRSSAPAASPPPPYLYPSSNRWRCPHCLQQRSRWLLPAGDDPSSLDVSLRPAPRCWGPGGAPLPERKGLPRLRVPGGRGLPAGFAGVTASGARLSPGRAGGGSRQTRGAPGCAQKPRAKRAAGGPAASPRRAGG